METVATLAIVVPLLGAALLAAAAPLTSWRVRDLAGALLAAATTVLAATVASAGRLVVVWFAGWEPVAGQAIGISLAVDPIGAGLAALAGLLTTAALAASWRYFEAVGSLYHALMLLFLGGMVGFALTGDLFNLFVFFELLTTAAYALTGYRIEHEGPLQGSFNFAVVNTVGAFVMLHGIALLYARTGTLNLADVGLALAGSGTDLVVVAAYALVTAGLFTKAAIVPFHFWLADAHMVAPSTVSVLLSGVMIQLGLYGWARVHWTVFAGVVGHEPGAFRTVLVVAGAVTAVLAAVLALSQQHLKRLLAYSSVSHAGLLLVGVALLDVTALAGAALYTVGHGLVKGALFLAAGIVLHRFGTAEEPQLHGRGRGAWLPAGLLAVGALGLAGLPPFATAIGRQLIEHGAHAHDLGWVRWVFLAAEALTAAAVLRLVARVFLGWGRPVRDRTDAERDDEEERETSGDRRRTRAVMWAPTATLLAVAVALGSWPRLPALAEAAARAFTATEAYRRAVMGPAVLTVPAPADTAWLTATSVALGLAAAALAAAVAAVAVGRHRLPRGVVAVAARGGGPALARLRALQSGHVGDYVAWLTAGTAALGWAFVTVLR